MHPIVAAVAIATVVAQTPSGQTTTIPLCPGLTIVTAVSQPQGDYESIKRIESVTAEGVRIRYSSYMPDPKGDYDSTTVAPPPWVPFVVYRTVRRGDLEASSTYMQQFAPTGVPETINGTTALGISRKSFRELKDKGKTPLTIFQAINPAIGVKEDGSSTMAGMEYRMAGELSRVDPTPVPVSVLVNDRPTTLQALRARGKLVFDDSEFFFLNDEANPISLKFRIGIAPPPDPEAIKKLEQNPDFKWVLNQPGAREMMMKQERDRDVLTVVRISFTCEVPRELTAAAPPAAAAAAIEESLAKTGRADVYSIYFAFNSDEIRDESEPTLREIAEVLRRHPDWKLAIEGHTDSIAGDAYNLQLSQRRAAAVRSALVNGKGVAGPRLTTSGFGESRPKDTNETLEGRARNRRVELVRLP
jgi:outer membrane protein OmpA-like peptidoglycan-associated protein